MRLATRRDEARPRDTRHARQSGGLGYWDSVHIDDESSDQRAYLFGHFYIWQKGRSNATSMEKDVKFRTELEMTGGGLEEAKEDDTSENQSKILLKKESKLSLPTLEEMKAFFQDNKKTLAKLVLVLTVFLLTLFLNKSKPSVAIIPTNVSCDGDTTSLGGLNAQGGTTSMGINYIFNQNGNLSYGSVTLAATWSSCAIATPLPFTPAQTATNTDFELINSANQTNIYDSVRRTQLHVALPSMTKGHCVKNATTAHCPKVPTYPDPSCFALTCSVYTYLGNYVKYSSAVSVSAPSSDTGDNYTFTGNVVGKISIDSRNVVSATCYAVIANSILPYFSTSNTVLDSPVKQCTTYPSQLDLIGISLSYANTAFSLITVFYYHLEYFTAYLAG